MNIQTSTLNLADVPGCSPKPGFASEEPGAASLNVALPAGSPGRKRVVCGTDFSPMARSSAEVAAMLASKWYLPMCIIHSANEWIGSIEAPLIPALEQIQRQPLDAEAARLREACEDVTTDLRHGNPAVELPFAAGSSAELIVLGSSVRTRTEKWLAGRTAEKVAEYAPSPTLVVKRPDPLLAWLGKGEPLRVLCAVNFTVSADAAISFVKRLTGLAGDLRLDVAYIVKAEDPRIILRRGTSADDATRRCEGIACLERELDEKVQAAFEGLPVNVHVRIANGNVAEEFVRLSNELGSDLLVVGSHQSHGLQTLSMPSFSHRVLVHASVNVLTVPLISYKPKTAMHVLRRILVVTDLSDAGNSAIPHAYSLLPNGGTLKIVHVCEEPVPLSNPMTVMQSQDERAKRLQLQIENAKKSLADLVPDGLAASRVNTTTEVVVHRSVALAICEEAEEYGAQAICMATSARSPATTMIFGSVFTDVVNHVHVPVFVVTPPKL